MHLYQLYLERPALLDQWTEEELLSKIASYPLDTGYKMLLALKKGGKEMHHLAIHCRDSILRRQAFSQYLQASPLPSSEVDYQHSSEAASPQMVGEGENNLSAESEDTGYTQISLSEENPSSAESPEQLATVSEPHESTDDQPIAETGKKKEKKKKNKFQLREYSGISPFSVWLLSFQEEDVEKKMRKEAKAAKRRALEESARKSVTSTPEVISEPLADILASQGHLDAAKKMYSQLMLKYPEKSSYFAAKIENLLKNI